MLLLSTYSMARIDTIAKLNLALHIGILMKT
jgi:hypothetical protein